MPKSGVPAWLSQSSIQLLVLAQWPGMEPQVCLQAQQGVCFSDSLLMLTLSKERMPKAGICMAPIGGYEEVACSYMGDFTFLSWIWSLAEDIVE